MGKRTSAGTRAKRWAVGLVACVTLVIKGEQLWGKNGKPALVRPPREARSCRARVGAGPTGLRGRAPAPGRIRAVHLRPARP